MIYVATSKNVNGSIKSMEVDRFGPSGRLRDDKTTTFITAPACFFSVFLEQNSTGLTKNYIHYGFIENYVIFAVRRHCLVHDLYTSDPAVCTKAILVTGELP